MLNDTAVHTLDSIFWWLGAHKYGFNVIFMKNGEGEEYFPEVSIETIHNNPYTIEARKSRWIAVKDLGWEKA